MELILFIPLFCSRACPREQNFKVGLISKLATSNTMGFNRTTIQETLVDPSTDVDEVYSLQLVHATS